MTTAAILEQIRSQRSLARRKIILFAALVALSVILALAPLLGREGALLLQVVLLPAMVACLLLYLEALKTEIASRLKA
jgi:uncharacterized membrane protein